jgi:hypothetical protein
VSNEGIISEDLPGLMGSKSNPDFLCPGAIDIPRTVSIIPPPVADPADASRGQQRVAKLFPKRACKKIFSR